MTVLLGPTPCHGCGVPVTVVRRPVIVWCDPKCRACSTEKVTGHSEATSVVETVALAPDLSAHSCLIPEGE